MGPIETAFATIHTKINTFLSGAYLQISVSVVPIVSGLIIIMIAWKGYQLLYGKSATETFKESITLIIKYIVILFLLDQFDNYRYWIADPLKNIPDSIANTLMISGSSLSSKASNIPSLLDEYLSKSSEYGWNLISITRVGDSLLGVTIVICAVIASVFSFIQMIFSEIGTSILLVFGPFALACSMFPHTQGIFKRWVSILTTLIILKVLVIIVLSMMLSSMSSAASAMASNTNSGESLAFIINFIVYSILVSVILMKTPDMAALMGGATVDSAEGLTSSVMRRAHAATVQKATHTLRGYADRAQMGMVDRASYPASSSSHSVRSRALITRLKNSRNG